MLKYEVWDKKNYYLLILLVLSTLIFSQKISGIFFLLFGLLCWGIIYITNRQNSSIEFVAMRLLVLSLPLSFVNIFGQAYGNLNVSWFNLFFLFIIMVFIFKNIFSRKITINYLVIISFLLIIISALPLLKSINFADGLRQYINIIVSFILIIIASSFKHKLNAWEKEDLALDYILTSEIAAAGVFLQIIYVKLFSGSIGNYAVYGSRKAYGFLFSDYSFLSLFLASGAMMVFFIKRKNGESNIGPFIEMAFLLLASILSSARTGITAFIIVFAIYSVFKFRKLLFQDFKKAITLVMGNLLLVGGSFLLISRIRQTGLVSDSGRTPINQTAFEVFINNPITGFGFGVRTYSELIGTIPHNIILQALAQGGLIYTTGLLVFLFLLLGTSYVKYRKILPVIACVLVGALFIPDIFNSRFLPALFLLLTINIVLPKDERKLFANDS